MNSPLPNPRDNETTRLLTIVRTCPYCKGTRTLMVDPLAYHAWQKGMLIQKAFPNLSRAQCEELQTGFHDACFNVAIGDPDEGGEDPLTDH